MNKKEKKFIDYLSSTNNLDIIYYDPEIKVEKNEVCYIRSRSMESLENKKFTIYIDAEVLYIQQDKRVFIDYLKMCIGKQIYIFFEEERYPIYLKNIIEDFNTIDTSTMSEVSQITTSSSISILLEKHIKENEYK